MAAFEAGLFGQHFVADQSLGRNIALVGRGFLNQYKGCRPRQRQKVKASLSNADVTMSKYRQANHKSFFRLLSVDYNLYAVAVTAPELTWVTLIEPAVKPGKIQLTKTKWERKITHWKLLSAYLDSLDAQP